MFRVLANRIANIVARAVLQRVDDSKRVQLVQLGVLADEVREDVERFQNYGFTGNPPEGAEAVVLFVGGRRDHGLAIAVDDRRYRVRNLESGEVAVYTDQGDSIVLRRGGTIEVTGATKVLLTAPTSVLNSSIVELGQPAVDFALKGTAFNTALQAFLTALGTYAAAIQPIADPSGAATVALAVARATFGTAVTAALSTKVKVG